jgi:predicted dehydrogenase
MDKTINIGVIGAGNFAHFALTEFVKISGVKLYGVFDENKENALTLKTITPDIKIYDSLAQLYADDSINLVYIATPPYLHYSQSKQALKADKHVICEKPAAIKLAHAIELRALAENKNLLFVVNLMQRYNPLYLAVNNLIQQNILGEFLHGFFENYASDEFLNENHWFWQEDKSGGIFIEHGVHFFDMFEGWLGKGEVIAAQKLNRKNHSTIWDKVQATVLFSGGLVNFYHAFDQPKLMDRQEMRLQFEKGEITLYEWVPTRLRMTAICTETELLAIKGLFPTGVLEIIEHFAEPKTCKGQFKEISVQYKIRLDTGDSVEKQNLYQHLVSDMFKDQLAWIKDGTHIRKIDENNAVNSLKLAEDSDFLATKIYAE